MLASQGVGVVLGQFEDGSGIARFDCCHSLLEPFFMRPQRPLFGRPRETAQLEGQRVDAQRWGVGVFQGQQG